MVHIIYPAAELDRSQLDRSQEIIDAINALRVAIEAARRFDDVTGQPNCEDPEKLELLRKIEDLDRRLRAIEGS